MRVLAHFPPGVFLDLRVLAHFELYQVFVCIIVLNIILIYILGQNVSKNQIIKTISSLHVPEGSNTLKLYTLKALLSKNRLYFFFLIF